MKQSLIASSALAAFISLGASASAAMAQEAGDIQVKVLATAVLPDGEIDSIEGGTLAATVSGLGVTTAASDNYVPTVAIEYFVSSTLSIETICCMTAHHVNATAPTSLAGATLVDKIHIVPATFTLKYHLGEAGGIRPYVGAGPTYFIFLGDEAGAGATSALGATGNHVDDTFGLALQAGVDVPVNESLLISLDAKRYFISPEAHWYNAAGTEVLHTKHNLDPWVLSVGVGFHF